MLAKLLPMGQDAVLVEVGGTQEVLALTRALGSETGGWRADIAEVVPAARTVLVRSSDPSRLSVVRAGVADLAATTEAGQGQHDRAQQDAPITLQVTYDGPDLDEVAELTGMSVREVIQAHTGTPWRVGFIGFVPGFGYLVGGDPRLRVPRRTTPRTSVPAGSVGLAGEFSGVYPRSSPGGWQVLGRTDAPLWQVERDPPALLRPGATVHFEVAP